MKEGTKFQDKKENVILNDYSTNYSKNKIKIYEK
jgi:hypothetical protein